VIKIKQKIFFFIKSVFVLLLLLTVILFFYSALFFDSSSIEKKSSKNEIINEAITEEKQLKEEKLRKQVETQKLEKKIKLKKIKTSIKDGLYATVGNKAITRSDIMNEIKSILILNNMSYSEENKQELQRMAVKAVIKRNIKQIEIDKKNFLKFNQNDLSYNLERLAKNAGMGLEAFKDVCESNGLDFSVIENQLKTELLWNSLIFYQYGNKITIDIDEINNQLRLNKNKNEFTEYLISEIIVKAVTKDKLESLVNEIKKKIEIEGFKNTAMKLSISESSINGGDLGWLSENKLAEKFRSILAATPLGGISKAILVNENILIFQVRDKRIIEKEINLEELKNQLVDSEKTKMLNMYSRSHFENLRRLTTIKFFNE
tara:strand:+ start:415 stop:1539 length:1125 start_codon:yes stop_codon:yes gene_type:complete